MCKTERICFVPVFLFLTPFPKAKLHYEANYRFFAASQKVFVKMAGKNFISGKRSTENLIPTQKVSPFSIKR